MKLVALTFFLSSMLSGASAQASASLCTQVFVESEKPESLHLIIENLASMKLELDQTRMQGVLSPVYRSLENEYKLRYQNLLAQGPGRISEASLRELIKKKVLELQNRNENTEVVARAEEKQAMREGLPTLSYSRDRIDTEEYGQLVYIPKIDSVLVHGGTTFRLVDLQRGKSLSLGDLPRKFKAGHDAIYGVMKSGEVFQIDLVTKERSTIIQNIFDKDAPEENVVFSPSAKWLAIRHDSFSMDFIDPKTGKSNTIQMLEKVGFLKSTFRRDKTEELSEFEFVSDHELLIYTSLDKLYKFDITTGEKIEINLGDKFIYPQTIVRVLGDGSVAFQSGRRLAFIKILDLGQFVEKAQHHEYMFAISELVPISSSTLIATLYDGGNKAFVMNRKTMEMMREPLVEGDRATIVYPSLALDSQGRRFFLSGSHIHNSRVYPHLEIFKALD